MIPDESQDCDVTSELGGTFHPISHTRKIPSMHYSATLFDALLSKTENYTIETALTFIKQIADEGARLGERPFDDLQTLETLRIAINLRKVRSITGKRPTAKDVSATTKILYKHSKHKDYAVDPKSVPPPPPPSQSYWENPPEVEAKKHQKISRPSDLGPAFADNSAAVDTDKYLSSNP